ncbi:hypothetical protein P43SY_001646 [Pythium insidiosum]|uniref:Integrase catalytic domain-containing protein n=1 Tax=Pythium insidiosum TaxID=114742 RepID=A0AAD5L8C6_PYTIN|nr:hypothetical protein P43SY_001646 [Pythium insidiosum]
MDHLLRFDELCLKLAAVGERINDDEKLVVLLGTLPQAYDATVRIIVASNGVTLLIAKEMLRREYETLQRREKKEVALKAAAAALQAGGSSNKNQQGRKGGKKQGKKGGNPQFRGKCFLCKQTGRKQANCPKKNEKSSDEFVFSVMDPHSDGVESTWLLDSGASSHMTGDVGDFVEYQDLPASIWVTVANGQRLEARGRGCVRIVLDQGTTVKLTDVLFVPQLDSRLVSVPALTAKGSVVVQFERSHACILVRGSIVAMIPKIGKLFVWRVKRNHDVQVAHAADETRPASGSLALWHARLAHVAPSRMKMISQACDGVPRFDGHGDDGQGLCDGCSLGKLSFSPFSHTSGSEVKTSMPFELVDSDVMGPIKPPSKGGAKYLVTFIDDFSWRVYVNVIMSKAEVFRCFKEFVAMVRTQYGLPVQRLRSDNGGEYVSVI